MLKTIALVFVLALAALLIYAATRPDLFQVQRSATIKAPPDKLFGFINDMHHFNTWNPYNKKDPNMKGSYRGPAAGPGAGFDFDGGSQVGKGSIEITQSTAASQVNMKLDMLAPMEAHNTVAFTLVPRGDSTEVTWAIQGRQPFIGKLMCVFFNMDKMIGSDFESGLADLKALAEKP